MEGPPADELVFALEKVRLPGSRGVEVEAEAGPDDLVSRRTSMPGSAKGRGCLAKRRAVWRRRLLDAYEEVVDGWTADEPATEPGLLPPANPAWRVGDGLRLPAREGPRLARSGVRSDADMLGRVVVVVVVEC